MLLRRMRMPGSLLALSVAGSVSAASALLCQKSAETEADTHTTTDNPNPGGGVLSAIGNTPLVEIHSLSRATGRNIFAKCEHLNPGGSVKDRAALYLITHAEKQGLLKPGGTIVEGTGGNTGVGLAMVAAAKHYNAVFAMPASIAQEKIDSMKVYGAQVILCPGVPFSDKRHYFHVAEKLGKENENYFFTNQFENLSNGQAHYETTAPEIWKQLGGKVDGFVCASGTGGTIGGVSRFFKNERSDIVVGLVDCVGSGSYDYFKTGKTYSEEGFSTKFITRSPGSSITEGIGIDRVTANFEAAMIDKAYVCTDREAVEMAYHLLRNDGLYIGPSAALNVVGAVKLARDLPPGSNVVTVICDGGDRYKSKLYTNEWLQEKNLVPMVTGDDISFVA